MTDREALALLLSTFRELVRMKACETGEKSHALWHMTDFIKVEIRKILKRLEKNNE